MLNVNGSETDTSFIHNNNKPMKQTCIKNVKLCTIWFSFKVIMGRIIVGEHFREGHDIASVNRFTETHEIFFCNEAGVALISCGTLKLTNT